MSKVRNLHLVVMMIAHVLVQAAPTISSSPSLCDQTPYPQLCTSLVTTAATTTESSSSSSMTQNQMHMSFRNSALAATKERVLAAYQLASTKDLVLFNAQEKAAWADCLELYEDTISQLESSSSSLEDSQTWLSAAITNQQTCQNGFVDLNLPFNTSNNISQHLSNLLAINKYILDATATATTKSIAHTKPNPKGFGNRRLLNTRARTVADTDDNSFPIWVSFADRKLLQVETTINSDLVVAQDGSGNYKTISDAITASKTLRSSTGTRFVIHVKAGIYNENVVIPKSMPNIMMIGDGIDITVVTGNKNVIDGSTTYASATFAVTGAGFIAKGMTFQNTAGPQKHQAVAFRSASDLSVYYSCSFKGYQDTLYAYTQRQFYRNCDIYGTVDFIFGDAVVVFQNCNIYVRKPLSNQQNTVTAQGRTDPNENTGISIINSIVAAAPDLLPVQGSFKTYLGRPWQMYSRTVFLETSIGSLIDLAGWLPWNGDFALGTLYYGEYMNTGTGAATIGRVNWPGFHVITSSTQAAAFTVANFLSGASWIPATGIPYTLGL